MTSITVCEFCPNPFFGLGSPGVSRESDTLREEGFKTLTRELEWSQEGKFSRLKKAENILEDIYNDHSSAGWDGRDALAIPYSAINEAKNLLVQIPEKFPMPEIIPEPTGEVGFEWYINPYKVLVLSLAGDGYIYYSGLFGFKNADHGSKPLAGQLHKKIIFLLEEVYK